MSEENQCEPGWGAELLARHRRQESTYSGKASEIPFYLRDPNAPGRVAFEEWAELPQINYAATPQSLYRLRKLRKALENNECFTKQVVEEQRALKIQYPPLFYAGLALAGVAVIYSMR